MNISFFECTCKFFPCLNTPVFILRTKFGSELFLEQTEFKKRFMRPETLSEKIEIIIMILLLNSAFSYNFKHFEQNKVEVEK